MATVELSQPAVRKTDGWRHQLEALAFVDGKQSAAGLGMAMGTGKSWVAVNRIVNAGSKLNLILAPKSVLRVWPPQFAQHAGAECHVCVLDRGTVRHKTETAERFVKRHGGGTDPVVLVLNYESAWRPEFAAWSLKQQWDHVICDEIHRIKTSQGRASKYCDKLRVRAGNRLGLSGTFMPHSPLDLFGSFRFLDVSIFGRWWTQFRARYAVTDRMFPSCVLKWINQDDLNEKFHSLVYVVGADVLDLPPAMHIERTCELAPAARKVYDDLNDELIAEVENCGAITVPNALVKLVRLQQITSGCLTDADGNRVNLGESEKRGLLVDLLEDLPQREPVVVFARFRPDLANIRQAAEMTGRRYGELSGQQNDLTDDATMPEDVDVLGVQIQSGGVGIDLTRACYAVYYSVGFNLGDYLQSLARINRPGQTRPVRYYHLVCSRTVDDLTYKAFDKKQEVIEYVLRELTHGDRS